jgi:recombination protein RecT
MTEMGSAVARQEERAAAKRDSVETFLRRLAPEMQRAMPSTMNGDRVARIALTLVRQSDLANGSARLSECTPESFAAALMTSVALGLEPGINGESYLIPYRDRRNNITECTLQIGYQGMQKLAWQSPVMQGLGSGFVWPEDDFDYDLGMDTYLKHKPAKSVARKPDAWPDLFYAWATLKTGGRHIVVLDREEVRKLRQGKEGPDPRFKGGDPQHWMDRKTCVKQLLKPLPKSVEAYWATQVDEQTGTQLFAQQVPAQIAEQVETVEAPPERPALGQADPDPGPLTPEREREQYATAEEAATKPDPWAVQE